MFPRREFRGRCLPHAAQMPIFQCCCICNVLCVPLVVSARSLTFHKCTLFHTYKESGTRQLYSEGLHVDFEGLTISQVGDENQDVPLPEKALETNFEGSSFQCNNGQTSQLTQEKSPQRENKCICDDSNSVQCNSVAPLSDNFYSKYYDEIKNYILSKVFPENVDSNYKMLLKKRAKKYCVKEGNLFYGNKIVLCTKSEQMQMLQDTHIEENTGVHLGVKKMSHIINSQCFWRGQYTDIANFVRQCSKCTEIAELCSSRENSDFDLVYEDSKIDDTSCPWQKVEINLHGPFTNVCGESVYITTVIDSATHYTIAKCLPENNYPIHLANFLTEVFCIFGIVKCYLSENCKQYVGVLKETLGQKNSVFQKMKIPFNRTLEDFIFCVQEGEEKCSWIKSHLQTFTNTFTPICEIDLFVFVLKLNSKLNQSSPFMKMFNRKPFLSLDDDKENKSANVWSCKSINCGRRSLRSSVLQCRHCEEIFTSKISFRIHQRTHTEEAHKRGMLEGQIKYIGEKDKKTLRRAAWKNKYLALRNRSSISVQGTMQVSLLQGRSSLCSEIPERRQAELRASTVEAVRRLLARTGENRKRRGKYKKFPLEVQDQMARYAIENGNLMAVRHFSGKLGVVVSESTIRNIVKCYQCFTPEVREEIGKFASTFGEEAAASHFSERLGREVRFGLIRKFKNYYVSRNNKSRQSHTQNFSNQLSVGEKGNSLSDVFAYSSDMRDEIGHYACSHTIPATIDYFSKKNMILKEHVVRKCKKMYKDKQNVMPVEQRSEVEQEHHQSLSGQSQQQVHLEQPHIQQPSQQPPQMMPMSLEQQHQQQQQQQLQDQHLVIHPEHNPQHLGLLPNNLHHDQQSHIEHLRPPREQQELEEHQQHSSTHESLSVGSNVSLLPLHHQSSNLQEGTIQSSSQTIDILQSSLNLLNNPQMNNPTTIIYNPSYQIPPNSNVPPSQLIPINQQQNSPHITFQPSNQCNTSNMQSSLPVSYQPQDVPISASVIINQNVATVQTFPNNHVYSGFAQTHSVQPATLSVTDNCLSLPSAGNQVSSLSHPRQSLPSSGLSAITVAVAPVQEQHFQASNSQPAVVLSQPMSQPILISHAQSGTALLQHFIDSQAHLTPCSGHLPHHLMGEIPGTSQSFSSIVEPQSTSEMFTQKLNCSLPALQFDSSSNLKNEKETTSFELSGSLNNVHRSDPKENNFDCVAPVESKKVLESQPSSTSPKAKHQLLSTQNSVMQESGTSQEEAQCIGDDSQVEFSECDDISDNDITSVGKNRKSKASVKKSGRKKSNKGKSKPVEHKRGTYAIYSPEIRAEMGKYAAEHGSQKACDFFLRVHGYNVAESTMRGLRDKYIRKREMCSERGNEVTSLGYAPRGRPMRLGQYDEIVQQCIKELVKSGEKISSFLAIATAKHVLMQYEPHLLEENGGKIKLNLTWAKSFLKRSGIKNYV